MDGLSIHRSHVVVIPRLIYLDEGDYIQSLLWRHPCFIAGSALQLQSFTNRATWEVLKKSTGGQSSIVT